MYYNLDLNKEIPKAKLYLCKPDRTVIGKLNEAYGKDLALKINGVNELTFNIPYKIERNHELIDNPHIKYIKFKYKIKVVYDDITEYHSIQTPNPTSDDSDYIYVQCKSIEESLKKRPIKGYKKDAIKINVAANDVLKDVGWVIGDYPIEEKYRSFNINSKNVYESLKEIADTFDTLLHFDTVNKKVNFYAKDYFATYKGLVVSDKNYLQSLLRENDNKEFCTRLYVYGNENLTINRVNPTGQSHIDDFSYFLYPFQRDTSGNVISSSDYMSDSLCHAILDYNDLAESKKGEFDNLLSQKQTLLSELATLNNQMDTLQSEKKQIEDDIFVNQKAGLSTTQLESDLAAKQTEIDNKQTEINNKQAEIDSVNTKIDNLRWTLSMDNTNNFTTTQLNELDEYIIYDEFKDDNLTDDQELYVEALEKMQEKKIPNFNIQTTLANFKSMITEQHNWNKLSLGSVIRTKKDKMGIDTKSQVIEMRFSFENDDVSLSLSNSVDYLGVRKRVMKRIYLSEQKANLLADKQYNWDSVDGDLTKYIDDQISEVNTSITDLNKGFERYAADGFISKDEALQLKHLKEKMDAESTDLVNVATTLGITTEKTNYQNALTALGNELTGITDATSYPISVLTEKRTAIQNDLNSVESTKSILINKITDEKDAILDSRITTEISDVNTSINNVQSELDEAISDGVVTQNEANTLKTSLEELKSESTELVDIATKLNISTEKTNYQNALSDLETELTTYWIDQTSTSYPITITASERDLIRLKFTDVQNKKSLLLNTIAEARDIDISGWGITKGGTISIQNKVNNIVSHATVPSDQIAASGSYLTSINVGDTSNLPSTSGYGTYYIGYSETTRIWEIGYGETTVEASMMELKWGSKDTTTLYDVELHGVEYGFDLYFYPSEIYTGMEVFEYHQPTGDIVISPMSAVNTSNKKLTFLEKRFNTQPIGSGWRDADGWIFKYLYIDVDGVTQLSNAGTSGGLNQYPPSPPSGSVAIGYMLVGYGKESPDGTLTTDKDILSPSGKPNFKQVIYHDIRYRDERVVKVDGNEMIIAETPYGKSVVTVDCPTLTYQTVKIPIGKGKRSVSVSMTLDDGTDYDNYEYGATLTIGRKSANNADGLGSPVWAVYTDASGNRGHVQQHRNTSPYGVHILKPQVWNKNYTLLYDADIEPDATNPDTLNIKLMFYNYSSSYTDGSFNLKINWHAL